MEPANHSFFYTVIQPLLECLNFSCRCMKKALDVRWIFHKIDGSLTACLMIRDGMNHFIFPAIQSRLRYCFNAQQRIRNMISITVNVFLNYITHELQSLIHAFYIGRSRGSPIANQWFFYDSDRCIGRRFQHAQKEIPVFKTRTHRFIIAIASLIAFSPENMGGRATVAR